MLLSGDTVRITDDREKAMKAQKGFGTEWTDDILDVSSYKYFSISLQHSKTSFTNNRFWVKQVKLMVQTFME